MYLICHTYVTTCSLPPWVFDWSLRSSKVIASIPFRIVTPRRQNFDKCFFNKENAGSWKPVRMSFVRIRRLLFASQRAGSEISWDCANTLIFKVKKYSKIHWSYFFNFPLWMPCHATHCQELIWYLTNHGILAFKNKYSLGIWVFIWNKHVYLASDTLLHNVSLKSEPLSHIFWDNYLGLSFECFHSVRQSSVLVSSRFPPWSSELTCELHVSSEADRLSDTEISLSSVPASPCLASERKTFPTQQWCMTQNISGISVPSESITPHTHILVNCNIVLSSGKMKWKIFLTFKEELRWQFLENIPLLETVAINSPGGRGITFSIGCEMKFDSYFTHNACQFCADPEKLVDCCKHHFVISGEWTFLRFCDRPPLIRSRALTARYLVQLVGHRAWCSIWCHGDVTTCHDVIFWPIHFSLRQDSSPTAPLQVSRRRGRSCKFQIARGKYTSIVRKLFDH